MTPSGCPAEPPAKGSWPTRRLLGYAALAAILLLGVAGPSEARCPETIRYHSGRCWYICYFVGQDPDGTCNYDYCDQIGCQ